MVSETSLAADYADDERGGDCRAVLRSPAMRYGDAIHFARRRRGVTLGHKSSRCFRFIFEDLAISRRQFSLTVRVSRAMKN